MRAHACVGGAANEKNLADMGYTICSIKTATDHE